MPQIFPICLFEKDCPYKKMKKPRIKQEVFIPVCTFKGTCNQKRILSVFDLRKAKWNMKEVRRRWKYAVRLG